MFGIFKSTPKKFIGHCLDPIKGYHTKEITPDSDVDARKLMELADGVNLYFVAYYENGERTETMVPASKKQAWLDLKARLEKI
jgi:hypothetical protein